MKTRLSLLLFAMFLFSVIDLHAQPGKNNSPKIPLQPEKSILYGYDTFINDQPLQNQQNIAIAAAFNGWLYAIYSYFSTSWNMEAVTILRSKDTGISWTVLLDLPIGIPSWHIKKIELLACGQDTTNLKLFAGYNIYNSSNQGYSLLVTRYNLNGGWPEEFLNESSLEIRDFEIASDDLHPANNSNPFSLAVIYSMGNSPDDDIIVVQTSSNGGMSFNKKYSIATSSHYLDKVALAYGRSPSCSSGRYFAAWEEQDNKNSVSGHIYTAHSEPNFNSAFTTPVRIDSVDATAANKASSPVIACQNSAVDNDSSNLTEVVLFDKYLPATQKFSIAGVYNKTATVSNNFRKLSIDASGSNKLQTDLCFNPFDGTFIMTYFDSTAQKLPCLNHDFNMMDPDNWNVLSTGYNDDNNLLTPHPQVATDFITHTAINAWTGIRSGGNGAAMFDAPFIYYTGDQQKYNDNKLNVKLFPNPASEFAILEFELLRTENVKIELFSSLGQLLANMNYPTCTSGKQQVKIDLSKYETGMYILILRAGDSFSSGKISVSR
jgi:hypothetical protein